jgi:hypothetical protein
MANVLYNIENERNIIENGEKAKIWRRRKKAAISGVRKYQPSIKKILITAAGGEKAKLYEIMKAKSNGMAKAEESGARACSASKAIGNGVVSMASQHQWRRRRKWQSKKLAKRSNE